MLIGRRLLVNTPTRTARNIRTLWIPVGATDKAPNHLSDTPIFPESKVPVPPIQKQEWVPTETRTGIVAVKKGMMSIWDSWGRHVPVTVLQLEETRVLEVKTQATHGYSAVVIGCKKLEISKKEHLKKYQHQIALCRRAMVGYCLEKIAEFRVGVKGLLPVGATLNAAHFVPGQFIDAQSTSIDKGFQGVMKRWGFKGQSASHGTSVSHRSPGSIGQRKDPGKVFKGKKMPGHMGNETTTVAGLQVIKIDKDLNLLYVKGSIPGRVGSFVRVRDSIWHKHFFDPYKNAPPFPTITQEELAKIPTEILLPKREADPIATRFNL